MQWTRVHGRIVEGYRVASGPSADYPYGTLVRQRPLFASRGLDLSSYFNGTLNIDISPQTFKLVRPEFTFYNVEWTDLHPPEHFSFSRCKLIVRSSDFSRSFAERLKSLLHFRVAPIFSEIEYDGWVYYPHPETKLQHFQNPSLLEVIAMEIKGIQYGDEVDVLVNSEEISIETRF